MVGKFPELALFNLAIDSKLRSCDLLRLRVLDVAHGDHALSRASVIQQKTKQPVRFELSEPTREAIQAWITEAHLGSSDYTLPEAGIEDPHTFRLASTRES